jgi:eukaryotic-like serine/threonine-protein kinase
MADAVSRTVPLVEGAIVGGRDGDARRRYVIARRIGAGAMGTVYEASAEAGSGSVAIKLLDTRAGKDATERRARFLREAEICARLDHPNLVRVLDHGIDDATGTPYLVMPLLAGEDLGALLGRVRALEPEVAAALFVQACRGVEAAHAAGVVHRDLKPSNLFLVESGGGILVKVADFGLAKVDGHIGEGLTASHAFMGSAQYVSPEQATNAKHVDARTDVWSLGMALFHALAGEPAFARTGSFMKFLVELQGKGVAPIQDLAPWLDFRLARLVHGALLRDIERRCPSVVELAIGLDMAVGIDASRRALVPEQLVAVSAATKARTAQRAVLPASWDDLLRS